MIFLEVKELSTISEKVRTFSGCQLDRCRCASNKVRLSAPLAGGWPPEVPNSSAPSDSFQGLLAYHLFLAPDDHRGGRLAEHRFYRLIAQGSLLLCAECHHVDRPFVSHV